MKLSEAIRLGSMMKPQGFNGMTDYENSVTCAMGAAYEAVGVDFRPLMSGPRASGSDFLMSVTKKEGWNSILLRSWCCPVCDDERPYLPIVHLNDFHRWTREQIADWVETIEQREPALTAETADGRSPQTREPSPEEVLTGATPS